MLTARIPAAFGERQEKAMIKDMAVVIDAAGKASSSFALALAKEQGAELLGICIVPEMPFGDLAQAELRYDMVIAERQMERQRAEGEAAAFEREAESAHVPAATAVICQDDGGSEEDLMEMVRSCDLILLKQSDPDAPSPLDSYLEHLVLHSGRPCLIVPYAGAYSASFRTITIAWDGSAACARALADGLPLMRHASEVEIVHITSRPTTQDARTQARLLRHLSAHGLSARFRTLVSTLPFAETILSHMADTGSDLLIMGAYGHSPVREAVFGGASRSIFATMTVPVLMSH